MPRKRSSKETVNAVPSDLTEIEQDLLSHLRDGYQLETDSLGGNPVLRKPRNGEAIRPVSATRSTVKLLEQRGLIAPGKSDDPLRIRWRLIKEGAKHSRGQAKLHHR